MAFSEVFIEMEKLFPIFSPFRMEIYSNTVNDPRKRRVQSKAVFDESMGDAGTEGRVKPFEEMGT